MVICLVIVNEKQSTGVLDSLSIQMVNGKCKKYWKKDKVTAIKCHCMQFSLIKKTLILRNVYCKIFLTLEGNKWHKDTNYKHGLSFVQDSVKKQTFTQRTKSPSVVFLFLWLRKCRNVILESRFVQARLLSIVNYGMTKTQLMLVQRCWFWLNENQ